MPKRCTKHWCWKFSSHQKKIPGFNFLIRKGQLANLHGAVLATVWSCLIMPVILQFIILSYPICLLPICWFPLAVTTTVTLSRRPPDTITVWSTEAQRTLQPKHVRPYSEFYFHVNRIDHFFNKPDVRIRLVHTLGTAVLYCLLHFNNSSDTGMWVPITAMVPFIFVTIVRAEAWDVFVWESARFLWVHQFSISVSNLDPALANCKTG